MHPMPDFPLTVCDRYRPNVAILLVDGEGKLLICERIDNEGAWQFPQGGVDKGEGFLAAMQREVKEEIGLKKKHYELIELRSGYRYKYPHDLGMKKKRKHDCIGQEQTYFLCLLKADKKKINIDQPSPEFRDTKWIKPKDFKLKWVPEFKQEVYRQVMKEFFKCNIK